VVQTILEKGIDVLIIDPLVSSHYVSENDNMAMDAVIKAFSSIAGQTGCAIEIVHHVRKGSAGQAGEMTADDARGASAVVGAARSVRQIQKMTEEEASAAGVKERWRHFRTVDAKSRPASRKQHLVSTRECRAGQRGRGPRR
jgi:RecA-family ATPase